MNAQCNPHPIWPAACAALAAALLLTAAQPAAAQLGWALSHQKINGTEDGFTGIPAQAHRPRLSDDLLDPRVRHETIDDPPAARLGPVRTSPALPRGALAVGRFQSVQVNVDEFGNNILGDAANEPSIAVDPTNPNIMVIGWRQFNTISSNFRQAGYAYSHDGGRSWTFPGVHEPGVFRSDPVLDSDSEGNIYYYSLRSDLLCHLFKSSDGGVSWIGPIDAFGGDKAWIAIDRTGGIGHGNLYAAWDHFSCCGDNWFTRSTDGGASFDPPRPIPAEPIWGVTTVGPDGAVYIAGRSRVTNTRFIVAKSSTVQNPANPLAFDFAVAVNLGGSQQSFLGFGPNPGGLMGQAWIAADHSNGPSRGMVYVLCSVFSRGDDPLDVRIARSTDGGQTWRRSFRVNDDPEGTNAWQWFGTLSVAPSGRLDVVWYDTRNSGQDSISEVFYAWSTNRGRIWSENIQVSPPFNSWVGWPQQAKLGDYIQMYSDEIGAGLAYAATFNGEQDIYFMRIDIDCNGNGLHDGDDIFSGRSRDENGNGVPDECECDPCDMNCDGTVDASDIEFFIDILFNGATPCNFCTGDTNGDGNIDAGDIEGFIARLFP